MVHMGNVHAMVTETCEDYKTAHRRNVYQTPKSYLSFIAAYKEMYKTKIDAIKTKESNVNLGLKKLIDECRANPSRPLPIPLEPLISQALSGL